MTGHPARFIAKCPTHIEGLDPILQGGFPAGRTTLIVGGPSAGKSVFGLEFLYRGALAGEAGILISFEERASALRANAATLGWQLEPLEADGRLFLFEARMDPKAVVTGDFGIDPFLAILEHKLTALAARRVVIDALDALMRLIGDETRVQNELLALHRWLEQRGITALLTAKAPRGEAGEQRESDCLDYMADCVICLDNRMLGQRSTRRLRVLKYRGSGFGSNEYPFVIQAPGITLLPISETALSHQPLQGRIPTGVPTFDELIGGGFRRASSVLITGSSGAGKTTLCSAFTQAACARGEKVLYVSFEESEAALVSTMQSSGIDLAPAVAAGTLRLLTALPEAMGAEHHLVRVYAALREMQPGCVVVESASACKRMGTEQAAFEFLMRLINRCKEQGITILTTNQTAGFMNCEEVSGIGISSIADTIIILRLQEDEGRLQRKLLIMKARGSSHSHRHHDLLISERGIEVILKGAQHG